jgi:hypothetical protein
MRRRNSTLADTYFAGASQKKQELAMPFEGYHAEAACNLSGIA